jgi:hypothetical protein
MLVSQETKQVYAYFLETRNEKFDDRHMNFVLYLHTSI